jgi:hypothetical protein
MSDKTYITLWGLLARERYDSFERWRNAWEMWPGAQPMLEVAATWAERIQDLNDAQIELEQLADDKRGHLRTLAGMIEAR